MSDAHNPSQAPSQAPTRTVALVINGNPRTIDADVRSTLLDLLRERLHLTGTKKGCDHGLCGACTVAVNGERVLSCLTLAASIDGSDVLTIEGIADGENLHPVQEAFVDHDGFQCGYCTPGILMTLDALMRKRQLPRDEVAIREVLSGNICRCTGYQTIVDAVLALAE